LLLGQLNLYIDALPDALKEDLLRDELIDLVACRLAYAVLDKCPAREVETLSSQSFKARRYRMRKEVELLALLDDGPVEPITFLSRHVKEAYGGPWRNAQEKLASFIMNGWPDLADVGELDHTYAALIANPGFGGLVAGAIGLECIYESRVVLEVRSRCERASRHFSACALRADMGAPTHPAEEKEFVQKLARSLDCVDATARQILRAFIDMARLDSLPPQWAEALLRELMFCAGLLPEGLRSLPPPEDQDLDAPLDPAHAADILRRIVLDRRMGDRRTHMQAVLCAAEGEV
jgi:hypothetical protein